MPFATPGSRRMKQEDSSLREPPDEDVIIVVFDLVDNIPVYIVANATKGDLDNGCTRDEMLPESGDIVLARLRSFSSHPVALSKLPRFLSSSSTATFRVLQVRQVAW